MGKWNGKSSHLLDYNSSYANRSTVISLTAVFMVVHINFHKAFEKAVLASLVLSL